MRWLCHCALKCVCVGQNATTGWLGPDDWHGNGVQYWGPMNMLQALTMYAEFNPAYYANATSAVLRHVLQAGDRMADSPMNSWCVCACVHA